MNNKEIFEQNKDLLKSFSTEELNNLLIHYNFIIRKKDNLWELCYFSEGRRSYPYTVVGGDLAYLLNKMVKIKKEEQIEEDNKNIMSITNGC